MTYSYEKKYEITIVDIVIVRLFKFFFGKKLRVC